MIRKRTLNLIGVGGVGGHVAASLLPTLRPLVTSDTWWAINLIDPDRYTQSNVRRQIGAEPGEKKVSVWRRRMETELENCPPALGGISVEEMPFNLTAATAGSLINEDDVTILAVDNHPTRRVACERVAGLNNGILISGSNNQLTAGMILLYARAKGRDATTPYTRFHKEIAEAAQQLTLPRGGGCDEAESPPQRAYTNGLVAHTVLAVLYQVLTTDPAGWPDEVLLDAGKHTMRAVNRRSL